MALYIGLMSGSSMDGVDAALVDFDGDQPHLIAYRQSAFPEALRDALREARLLAGNLPLATYARLDTELGLVFGQAAEDLLTASGTPADRVRAIGSHGQTLAHQPEGRLTFTVQAGDPNRIAAITGITTVGDCRRMDMALGGQGAPLAPAFHAAVFSSPSVERAVVNVGGIANITVLPKTPDRPVIGFDTGPGNALLDDWALQHLGTPMDEDGRWALGGKVSESLLNCLMRDPYLEMRPPKSTGRDYFNPAWLAARLAEHGGNVTPQDVQATLLQFTARSIAEALDRHAQEASELLVCGGGALNPALMSALQQALPGYTVQSTEALGLAPKCVEAVMFAWLASRRLEGLAGNLPSVTGARSPVMLGGVYEPFPRD